MKIIFSRKGFDYSSGGVPSPILDGRPVSIPIPARDRAPATYRELGLGDVVTRITNGRIDARTRCHEDPMFGNGRCAFGQAGAAQSHLANQGVGIGDVFLFFGLFAGPDRADKHHRIFGYLRVEEAVRPRTSVRGTALAGFQRRHPHTIGRWHDNNTIYVGAGGTASRALPELRLTAAGRLREWRVPPWLAAAGLSYHGAPWRWPGGNILISVSRGQEFVSDITGKPEAYHWLEDILQAIERDR